MLKSTLAVALTFVLSGALTSVAHAAETKIAIVDMQSALQSVDAGKKAKSQLEKEFNVKKKELETEEATLKKQTEEFKKQSLVLSDEARNKKQMELQERIAKFQQNMQTANEAVRRKEADLTGPLLEKIKGTIAEVAKAKGYTMVLEKSDNTVLFSDEKDDLTNDVVAAFNKANKG